MYVASILKSMQQTKVAGSDHRDWPHWDLEEEYFVQIEYQSKRLQSLKVLRSYGAVDLC
jgi:hypothetical protein